MRNSMKLEIEDLIRRLPATVGTIIAYADFADASGARVGTPRFRSLSWAWRREVFRRTGLQSDCVGQAFRFLSADEAVTAGIRRMHLVGRAAGRAVMYANAIPAAAVSRDLSSKYTLLCRQAAFLHATALTACGELNEGPKPLAPRVGLGLVTENGR